MIHYIYKIHFLCGFPTGRYYIGKRSYSGEDLKKDKYIGSGNFCKVYFKEYGSLEGTTYIKEILEINPSKEINSEREIIQIGNLWESDKLCQNLHPGGNGGGTFIKINQYSIDGKFIKTWNGLKVAADFYRSSKNSEKTLNAILKRRSRSITWRGYIWRYYNGNTGDIQGIENPYISGKPIIQYDLAGKFIKTYHSISEALSQVSPNGSYENIYLCLIGRRKTAFGFMWTYSKGSNNDIPKNIRNKKHYIRIVLQYTKDLTFVKEHPSITAAANSVNGSRGPIHKVCIGHQRVAYGYIWKYKN